MRFFDCAFNLCPNFSFRAYLAKGGLDSLMGIFGSKTPKKPQIKIIKQSGDSRVLDFSEFMDREMKSRIRAGVLEWMDKVDIFETFYIPNREAEGWVLIGGNYKSPMTDERFVAKWQVGDQVVVGKYNDTKFTVTERFIRKG